MPENTSHGTMKVVHYGNGGIIKVKTFELPERTHGFANDRFKDDVSAIFFKPRNQLRNFYRVGDKDSVTI